MRKPDTEALVTVSPRKIVTLFLLIIAFLIALYLVTQAIMHFGGHDAQHGFRHQFDLEKEHNIPTWYSSSALLLCSLLLAMIWKATRQTGQRFAQYWLVLSIGFLYLSLDEAASFHELMEAPSRQLFQPGPYMKVVWVIPGTLVSLIFGISLWRFLANLPRTTRHLFLLAGFIYLGGAMGMELLSTYYLSTYGRNMVYSLTIVSEEGLEMLGILVFLHALLAYLRNHLGPVKIVFKPTSEASLLTTDPLVDNGFEEPRQKQNLPIPVAMPRLE
jgi:hypothetical protein